MMLKLIISYLFYHTIAFSEYYSLESVNVNSKANGILVYLKVDSLPDAENLTGWQSQNDWFYITLYQCRTMKSRQLLKEIDSNILDFEMIENINKLKNAR